MALSKSALKRAIDSVPEGHDVGVWVVRVCRAIEAEVRKQDTELIRQLVAALEGYRRNHNDTQPCDAERAGRAWLEGTKLAAAPQQEAQEPVAWYVTGCGRLLDEDEAKAEARHIGGTARAMPLYTAPQPSPAAQGDALSDDAVRVPLDSLHADAAYLIGRLREGSMSYARVIEIIRERIDAAKAAIRARAEQGDALDAERLDWLLLRISGAEFRRIGVHYSGNARRADVDAARKQGANHD